MLAVHRHDLAAARRARLPSPASPAMTSVSLFASATRFPRSSAASVASSPAAPTTALSTMSTSSRVAASTRHAVPLFHASCGVGARFDHARRTHGENCAACSRSSARVAVRGERGDAKPLALAIEHAQRRRADRAGRAEHRDPFRRAVSVTAGRAAAGGPAAGYATGSTNSRLSKRSSMPP